MSEMRTVTFVVHEDINGGDYIEVAAVGDNGEGDRLVEAVEASDRRLVSIDVSDASEVPPDSAFWTIGAGALGPRPDTAQAIGGMTGEIAQRNI